MENDNLGVEDLPDDLTPFIIRTTLDHVEGGASGDVWKCNYNADGISAPVQVAVKAFRFSQRDGLETINRKISREIGILKILRHNNIVPLWGIATGFGRMPELRCLVSPWMPNGTLNDYLESNHDDLTVLDRFRMLEDVSAGLRYLHSMSVAHGDITGANILIDEGGHAKLIDFGLSTIVRPLLGQSHLAASSIRPGAIRYAAPELVLSDDVRELPLEKIDIYSFGCVMLQVLSGRLPWSEIKERPESRIPVMISKGSGPQRPDGHPAIIDLDWNFIQKCLQPEPELRPSAHEVFDVVMDRFSSSDSSRPPDGPPDDAQDLFPGASPREGSGDSDTAEQMHNSLSLHPAHEAKPSVLMPRTQVSCPSSSYSSHPHPRVTLNNVLQSLYGPSVPEHVRWELFFQGPPHALTWMATIYIHDMNYGYGQAATKGAAQDKAAMMALERLQGGPADSAESTKRTDVPETRSNED
ncbi:kinase-like domain-containing protein [Suillus paluster]|uniref:kinase-like domain-containing protein n=1 Tax=Suillus paluster TaxID=48578 RepID=UPI001B869BFA|nr:kinase-like domain-containing protein [Suillus paluster]KAG1722539.1 kinase-like domain-containing protein [Suillus paluster]